MLIEVPRSKNIQISGTFPNPNPLMLAQSTAGTNGRRIAVQIGGVLQYKWEVYCSVFPFVQGLEARKAQRYKWGAYCGTNWSCTAVLVRQAVGVGGS